MGARWRGQVISWVTTAYWQERYRNGSHRARAAAPPEYHSVRKMP
jgi:hypothetical protein